MTATKPALSVQTDLGTMSLLLCADGIVFAPSYSVADALGCEVELVHKYADTHRVQRITASGMPGFEVSAAAKLIAAVRAARDEHDSRWHEYQAYLEEQKRLAREKREAEAAAAREAERKRQAKLRRHMDEQAAREAEDAAARAAAERAEREGDVVPFDSWKAS